ncbi:MAG: hypothetical protein JSS02_05500, partial [Planctomycetes bacterium]|nr:hypothetical protein [Planctomycetota bacterium]
YFGVFERAGDLKAAWGDKHLTIKQAAPGTFFAVFGAIIVTVSLCRPVLFKEEGGVSEETKTAEGDKTNRRNYQGSQGLGSAVEAPPG